LPQHLVAGVPIWLMLIAGVPIWLMLAAGYQILEPRPCLACDHGMIHVG
jgi:hypothetical protein